VKYNEWLCELSRVFDIPRNRIDRGRKKFIQCGYVNDREIVFTDKLLQRVIELDFMWPQKDLAFRLTNERSMSF
jgi:hypothetical protein